MTGPVLASGRLCLRSCDPAGCADLNSLDSLSPQEKKRQGYIHELIDSEDRYVTDLQIVLEVTEMCLAARKHGKKKKKKNCTRSR